MSNKFNTSKLSSFILSQKKLDSELLSIVRNAIEFDIENGANENISEFAIVTVIKTLESNGLKTYATRVRTMAEREFGFYQNKNGETGYNKFPTESKLNSVFSKFQSVESWNEKNKERVLKQAKKTAEEKRKTAKLYDVFKSHCEKMRKELNESESKKLDALIAHLEKMPNLFK